MATIINNPAIPPSAGLTAYPYDVQSSNPNLIVPSGGGDPASQANLWLQAMIEAPYEGYVIRTFMAWDEGTRGMAVAAAPGTPAEVVRVHAGIGSRVVAWFGRRDGKKPVAPAQEPDTATQVFRGEQIVLDTAILQADGRTWTYAFSGLYLYVLRQRLSPNNGHNISFGAVPYATSSAGNNVFTPNDLDPSLTVSPS